MVVTFASTVTLYLISSPEMERYKFTSSSEENAFISLGLFLEVSNARQLRSEAASGQLEAVLLDPTLVNA